MPLQLVPVHVWPPLGMVVGQLPPSVAGAPPVPGAPSLPVPASLPALPPELELPPALPPKAELPERPPPLAMPPAPALLPPVPLMPPVPSAPPDAPEPAGAEPPHTAAAVKVTIAKQRKAVMVACPPSVPPTLLHPKSRCPEATACLLGAGNISRSMYACRRQLLGGEIRFCRSAS